MVMLNAPKVHRPTQSSPRGVVIVNGTIIPWTRFSVVQADYTQADTFSIDIPFSAQDVADNEWISASSTQASKFLVEDKITVEVWAGYPWHNTPTIWSTKELNRIMYGQLDTVEFRGNSMDGEIAVLTGRNMVGPMLDNDTTYMRYANMTGSQIAQAMAAKYGLGDQITPTSTLAGIYFQQEAITLTSNISEWDLLVQVASFDGYIVHVNDDALYYGPTSYLTNSMNMFTGPMAGVNEYTWGHDILQYDITRSPTGVQDIKVTVKSYNIEFKTTVEGIAQSHAQKVGAANTGSYSETLVWPGLTQAQAQAKAEDMLRQLSQHQIQGNIMIDGQSFFSVYNKLILHGLGKGLDTDYYIVKIQHDFQMPQNQETVMSGTGSQDGYICTMYISSQLLISSNSVNNPLGLGVPLFGQTNVDTTTVSASGKVYPQPGFRGLTDQTISQARSWIAKAITVTGADSAYWEPGLVWLAEEESSDNPTEVDPKAVFYSQRWGYQHAKGLMQLMPPTFDKYAIQGYNTNIFDPVSNVIAAIRYIQANYTTVDNIPNIGTPAYGGY